MSGHLTRVDSTPVKIRLASDQLINIDDEPKPRQIVSATGENGVTTFLISGSSAALHNRERRAALARASSLLRQAGTALMALKAGSEEPETVSGALGELVDWLRRERERATAKPSPRQLIEGSGDKINSEQLTWTITSHLMTLTAIAA